MMTMTKARWKLVMRTSERGDWVAEQHFLREGEMLGREWLDHAVGLHLCRVTSSQWR